MIDVLTPELKETVVSHYRLQAFQICGCTRDGGWPEVQVIPDADMQRVSVFRTDREKGTYNHHSCLAKWKANTGLRGITAAKRRVPRTEDADFLLIVRASQQSILERNRGPARFVGGQQKMAGKGGNHSTQGQETERHFERAREIS